MRRGILALAASATVLAAVVLAAGCDSTLNLGGGEGGATQAEAPTCASTCEKLITCGYAREDERPLCLTECTQKGTAADLACAARAPCAELRTACAPASAPPDAGAPSPMETFAIEVCRSACDSMKFFDCLTASELSACRYLCETSTPTKRDNFNTCARGGNCGLTQECYAVFKE